MKNKRIIIFLGILVLLMVVLLVILNNNLHNKELAGKKINSWLYEYDFEEKDSIQNIIIKDNKIYYLANKEDIYELKEINIFTNKTKKIGSIKSDVCFFYNEYLSCSKGEEKIIYNLNLKEIYKGDNFFKIVPYQNSFLIISDKDIYLNNKKINFSFKYNFEKKGNYVILMKYNNLLKNINFMFYGCSSLISLDLSKFNI